MKKSFFFRLNAKNGKNDLQLHFYYLKTIKMKKKFKTIFTVSP